METADFFRTRIDAMINLNDPLAVLATRLPWAQIEASLAVKFERRDRPGQGLEGQDMFGPRLVLEGAGTSKLGKLQALALLPEDTGGAAFAIKCCHTGTASLQ